MGGLAPDTDKPMPTEMREQIRSTWHRIQQVIPDTKFNFGFWDNCIPRRSTYPACRAVLAAKKQNIKNEGPMIRSIQAAYYLHAQNPSDKAVLVALAEKQGLDSTQFKIDIESNEIQRELEKNIALYDQFTEATGIRGFPSLVLKTGDRLFNIPQNYTDAQVTIDFIESVKEIN
jgi:putative protein-disulfide isomerase